MRPSLAAFGPAVAPALWAWPVLLITIAFFAVGCPVCTKLVLLALGTTGSPALYPDARCPMPDTRCSMLRGCSRTRLPPAAGIALAATAGLLLSAGLLQGAAGARALALAGGRSGNRSAQAIQRMTSAGSNQLVNGGSMTAAAGSSGLAIVTE